MRNVISFSSLLLKPQSWPVFVLGLFIYTPITAARVVGVPYKEPFDELNLNLLVWRLSKLPVPKAGYIDPWVLRCGGRMLP